MFLKFRPCLFAALIVLSSPVFAQILTLDETINTLNSAAGARSGTRLEFRWDPFFQGGTFAFGNHYGIFTAAQSAGETGYLMLDSKEVFTTPMPWLNQGELVFPEPFVSTAKDAFSRYFEDDASRFRIAAIIIDPGHGGKDPGAMSREDYMINGRRTKAIEKEIVLEVSKRLKTVLERAYPDKRILMTRNDDTYPSLADRTVLANSVSLMESEAIIYISIHANSSFNARARGYEVWYLDPNHRRDVLDRSKYAESADVLSILNDMLQEEYTRESIMIAESILKAIGETLGNSVPSRGIKPGGWEVVRNSRMPAVLVELGFVSNSEDVQLMTTEDGLRKFTEALYKGINDFVGVFERSGGFTVAQ
ncbi:MAG: N-acetylmuramoyl-L-alanine amidase [Treponema sp.]|nr:N-acetylmuramoyl-L-alanine amidase [Treponema sp.]